MIVRRDATPEMVGVGWEVSTVAGGSYAIMYTAMLKEGEMPERLEGKDVVG